MQDEQTPPEGHRLTPEEVGERVGAILGDAEREAREIIASARREGGDGGEGATLADLTHALERLSARFDAFELATAAQIEEVGRQLRESIATAVPREEAETPKPRPRAQEDTPALAAARVRAIDLALAGYSREVIANELATGLERAQVETLLEEILIN
jgi:hypothetical protein